MSHGDRVNQLPDGFGVIGTSENAPYAAIADEARKIYGVQFHPEVVHTPNGAKMLENFTHAIAGCKAIGAWRRFATRRLPIFAHMLARGAICGLSGGVDSSWWQCCCTKRLVSN